MIQAVSHVTLGLVGTDSLLRSLILSFKIIGSIHQFTLIQKFLFDIHQIYE